VVVPDVVVVVADVVVPDVVVVVVELAVVVVVAALVVGVLVAEPPVTAPAAVMSWNLPPKAVIPAPTVELSKPLWNMYRACPL
jgi:hypothetical protein